MGRILTISREPVNTHIVLVLEISHVRHRMYLRNLHTFRERIRLDAILISQGQVVAGMFAEILPRAASLILTRSRHARAASPEILRLMAEGYGGQVRQTTSVASALGVVRSLAGGQE